MIVWLSSVCICEESLVGVLCSQPVDQKHLAVVCPMRNVYFASKASYKWSLQQGELLLLEKDILNK